MLLGLNELTRWGTIFVIKIHDLREFNLISAPGNLNLRVILIHSMWLWSHLYFTISLNFRTHWSMLLFSCLVWCQRLLMCHFLCCAHTVITWLRLVASPESLYIYLLADVLKVTPNHIVLALWRARDEHPTSLVQRFVIAAITLLASRGAES